MHPDLCFCTNTTSTFIVKINLPLLPSNVRLLHLFFLNFFLFSPQSEHLRPPYVLSLRLQSNCHKKSATNVYDVEGVLCIHFPYNIVDAPANHSYNNDWNRTRGSLSYPMKGFWSEKLRKLCMVGETSHLVSTQPRSAR